MRSHLRATAKGTQRMKKGNKKRESQQAFHLQTRKSLGQHFLEDKAVIAAIADAAAECARVAMTKQCVEIGPGAGALTRALLQRELKVTALEKDDRAAGLLRTTLALEFAPRLAVKNADVLQTLIADELPSQELGKAVLVGNLPYYITSDILLWYATQYESVSAAIFMVQDEVADRLAAKAGTKAYGRLSVRMQLFFKVTKLFVVPPDAFNPPPQVNSAVVRLEPSGFRFATAAEDDFFSQFTAKLFAGRRKMLRRVLSDTVEQLKHKGKDEEFWRVAESVDVHSDTRPDAIPPSAILTLYRFIFETLKKREST